MGTQPTVWNDPNGTPALRTQLLWDIRRQQSPGDIHIMDALRTPAGRPVRPCYAFKPLGSYYNPTVKLSNLVLF